ncbi:Fc receptor-like protein 1 [Rousettus aegyptiacus]|uniref:Fc receptor-like protein 1 n=1 Tax=Rousettus aegyptiacus TaxID=9407 RepID=UPI00168D2D53|nr:Fc receptor-like protein 1 [Rousettus aegyptiacus]
MGGDFSERGPRGRRWPHTGREVLAKGGLGACRGRRADPVSTWLGLDLISNAAQEPRTPLPSTVACSFSLVLLLRARPPQPTEGTAVTLTCETWPPPQQAHVPLQFRFFRDDRALQPGWSRSPELQVAAVWSEDSRSYWCEAQAAGSVIGRSRPIQVQVQRVSVYNVSLETRPPGGRAVEGQKLVLVCLVAGGTGEVTFVWYKGALGLALETRTQRSLTAEFEVPAVKESDAELYYCAADNGRGPCLSGLVSVTVTVPASRPVLTVGASGARAEPGDVLRLHCEAPRGSPPILYRFYRGGDSLGSSQAPSGGGASLNLSVTEEHSGNYFCEADNGLGAQRSEAVTFNVTAPAADRKGPTSVIVGAPLGSLGLGMAALLFYCWLKRKVGRRPAGNAPSPRRGFGPSAVPTAHVPRSMRPAQAAVSQCSPRSPAVPPPRESTYLNSAVPVRPRPTYENVNVGGGDEIYSLVYHLQQEQPSAAAEPLRTEPEDKYSAVIYAGLKKPCVTDEDYEDAM